MPLIIDGGILAGGLSTRMNGQDKGLESYLGQPMASHICDTLRPFVRSIVINCNRNIEAYQRISPLTCIDTTEGFHGPLAGILSILESSDADFFFISPCDTPKVSKHFFTALRHLLDEQFQHNQSGHVLIAAKSQSRHHPLHMCISASLKPHLRAAIESGNRKVMSWMQDHQAHWLEYENEDEFVNFNSLADLTKANASHT